MMIRRAVLVILGAFSVCSLAQNKNVSSWDGAYFFEQTGETLIDGSQVYIRTDIKISDNGRAAAVKMSTWHAMINCDGPYEGVEKNGVLALSYKGHAGNCNESAPQYEIKKRKGKLYIKGEIIFYAEGKWVTLSPVKSAQKQ